MSKLVKLSISVSLLLFFSLQGQAAYTWLGGADIWGDPANWDCTCVPGPGDEVLISAGTVDLAGSTVEVDMITFTGGTIIDGGGGSLATTGSFGWTGGTISAVVIIMGSALDMSGAGTKILKGELYITPGSFVGWAGGAFLLDGGALFNSGTFTIESDADITAGIFPGVIENDGTFIKTMGTDTTDVSAFFHNFATGKIEVGTGVLALNSGLYNEAEVKVDVGTTLDLTFESIFEVGSLPDGIGKIKFSGDSSYYKVPYFGAVEFEFSGGVFMAIDGLVETTGAILIADAELTGTGTLVAEGTADWEKGEIMHDLTFTVGAAGSLSIATAGLKKLYGGLVLDGPTFWTGGDIEMYGTAFIDNASTFTTDFDGVIAAAVGEGAITIDGTGVFEKTGGGGFTTIDPVVTNFGTIKASGDTLDFESFVTNHSTVHAASSGNVSFSGGSSWLAGSDMTGTGELGFYFGTNTFSTPISSSNKLGFFTGSTNTVDALLTNDNEINLNSTGKLNGSSSIKSEGDFNFTGGIMDVPVTIEAGSTLDISGSASKTISETLTVKGTATLYSTATDFNVDAPGTIANIGVFNLEGGVDILNSGASGTFTNSGTLVKNSSSSSTLDLGLTNTGTIKGVGTLNPTVSFFNSGVFEPGNSPGVLTLDDDFTNGTQINIEILDGSGAGTGHDELKITGTVSLEDSLLVTETGVVPDGTYTILSCTGGPGCISGTFEKVTLPANYTINYNAMDVTVTKNSVLPVELLYFKAKADDKDILLNWETASEINNEYFQIERSANGLDFMAIGVVEGLGNSTMNQAYFFNDENILNNNFLNTIYYRLKQIDLDGHFEFSEIVAVETTPLEAAWSIRVLPYSDGRVQVIYEAQKDKKVELALFDMNGKQLFQKNMEIQKGTGSLNLYLGKISSGLYLIQIAAGKFQQTQQFYVNY